MTTLEKTKTISLKEKNDAIAFIIAEFGRRQDGVLTLDENLSLKEKDSNAWLIVLEDPTKNVYFSAIEWEIKGKFIRRFQQKETKICLRKWPKNVASHYIDAYRRIVHFQLKDHSNLLYDFQGNLVLNTKINPELQDYFNFLDEIAFVRELGIC